MKHILLLLPALLLATCSFAQNSSTATQPLPAFPGAEGWGANTLAAGRPGDQSDQSERQR